MMHLFKVSRPAFVRFIKDNAPSNNGLDKYVKHLTEEAFDFNKMGFLYLRQCSIDFTNKETGKPTTATYTFDDFSCQYADTDNVNIDYTSEWIKYVHSTIYNPEAYAKDCNKHFEAKIAELDENYTAQRTKLVSYLIENPTSSSESNENEGM